MSVDFFVDILTKENNIWKLEANSKCFNALKNLSIFRGEINEDIRRAELSKEDLDAIKHFREYDELTNLGLVKNDSEIVKKATKQKIDGCEVYLVDEHEQFTPLSFEEERKLPTTSIVAISAYKRKTRDGEYFDMNSFIDWKRKQENELDKLLTKKYSFDKIEESLDYLKLSEDEKTNVLSEKDSLEDDVFEKKGQLFACSEMIGILNFFEQFSDNCIAFIYSE